MEQRELSLSAVTFSFGSHASNGSFCRRMAWSDSHYALFTAVCRRTEHSGIKAIGLTPCAFSIHLQGHLYSILGLFKKDLIHCYQQLLSLLTVSNLHFINKVKKNFSHKPMKSDSNIVFYGHFTEEYWFTSNSQRRTIFWSSETIIYEFILGISQAFIQNRRKY